MWDYNPTVLHVALQKPFNTYLGNQVTDAHFQTTDRHILAHASLLTHWE